mgnify:CR=1 FL=1
MHSGAATNLAAAVGKIPITVVTVGFLIIIEILAVHEVDWLHSLLRELDLVSANVLAESDVMLLEEIVIIQSGTTLETMLPSAYNAMLRISSIWIFSDRQHCSTIIIIREHITKSVVSIRNLNL